MSCACNVSASEAFLFRWYPGDTASLQIAIVKADGSPWDLTDLAVNFHLAADDQPGAALLWQLTAGDGTDIQDPPTAGIVLVTPGPTRSALLAASKTYPALVFLTAPESEEGERLTLHPGYVETYRTVPAAA